MILNENDIPLLTEKFLSQLYEDFEKRIKDNLRQFKEKDLPKLNDKTEIELYKKNPVTFFNFSYMNKALWINKGRYSFEVNGYNMPFDILEHKQNCETYYKSTCFEDVVHYFNNSIQTLLLGNRQGELF